MRFEYKTVSTHTLEGLKAAERLQRAGWKIINSGLFLIQFEREKKERPRYKVRTAEGKIKSFADRRWCNCKAFPSAHIHPKKEGKI